MSVKLGQYDTPRRCWNRFNCSHASSLGGLNRYLPAGCRVEERVAEVYRSRLLSLTRWLKASQVRAVGTKDEPHNKTRTQVYEPLPDGRLQAECMYASSMGGFSSNGPP